MKQKGKNFHTDENSKNNIRIKDDKSMYNDNFIENTQIVDKKAKNDAVYDVEPVQEMTLKEKKKMVKAEKKLRKQQEKASKIKKDESAKVKEEKPIPVKNKKKKVKSEKKADEPKNSEKVIPFKPKEKRNSSDNPKKFSLFLESIKSHKKNIIYAVVIIVLLFIVVFAFTNRDRLTFSNFKNWVQYGVFNKNSEESFPIATNGDVISIGNFTQINSNLVYSSDTKFATINNFGRTIYTYNQSFNSPVLTKAADSDLSLVFNLGGKEYAINTIDSSIYKGEAEDNIIGASISKSGVYALVTAKDGYLSKLYVYTKDHKQIYAYSFADFYITSVSLDPKGKTAVLTGISAHDGSQLSCIYLLDFTKEEPVLFEEINDNILYYTEFLDKTHACIIGDSSAYTLSTRSKSLKTFSYDGKSLTAFDVNTDTNTYAISLSRSGDGRKCDVYLFSTKGALKNTITTELMISSVSTYKNRVAVLDTDTAYLYKKDGTLISQEVAGLDPHSVVLYSTTDAYVLGVSEIRRIDL